MPRGSGDGLDWKIYLLGVTEVAINAAPPWELAIVFCYDVLGYGGG